MVEELADSVDIHIILVYCLCEDLLKWQHHRNHPQCALSGAENHDDSHCGGNVLSRQASDNQFMVSWRKQLVACVESLVLCQVYFCDSKVSDLSVEGVAFSQNRCPSVGAARSRTLSMGPESRGSTRDAQLRAAPTGFRPAFISNNHG